MERPFRHGAGFAQYRNEAIRRISTANAGVQRHEKQTLDVTASEARDSYRTSALTTLDHRASATSYLRWVSSGVYDPMATANLP